jgi:hypothetical protein
VANLSLVGQRLYQDSAHGMIDLLNQALELWLRLFTITQMEHRRLERRFYG